MMNVMIRYLLMVQMGMVTIFGSLASTQVIRRCW